ncbi:MAG: ArsR family transcriptional regulator [Candidatus Margulisiibacteriota bacterium]|nr:MAG: transcriptional regulator [Candidatus Margulisbacteria bacterium GWD2_39_127]OGI02354.1 MAG: transcriptional regulator [Candidatus Margulisbacteria bacterium GWF2_38_17]OGI08487.1 MAG: transcriptional regulator [Candidatus Margulisbacteria bacterium GWE2_39_32]PZM78999.1 MAG: ArsR family transcriptional regulator [Candidatus Margulisiibacteriota bacterium]HAR64223.1 transcriptional regulator [Candidatus Margulisiibacteriota bacterium]
MNELKKAKYDARAKIVKAMAHPSRLLIIDELTRGTKCVYEFTELIGADTSTISKHLSVLKSAGLVRDEKKGLQVYYKLVIPCINEFFMCIDSVLVANADAQGKIARCCM